MNPSLSEFCLGMLQILEDMRYEMRGTAVGTKEGKHPLLYCKRTRRILVIQHACLGTYR